MIGVIDYEAGNAPSVLNALDHLGFPCRPVSTPDELLASNSLILPGVGSAKATLESLNRLDCVEALKRKALGERIPFLGICIGLQILFEHSEEGDTPCLGWLRGRVRLFPKKDVRVPQIGWNEVRFEGPRAIREGLRDSEHCYFVNSYYAVPDDARIVAGTTHYGVRFCSMLVSDNIFATQFHVEKSGPVGLKLLANFASLGRTR